MQTFKEFTCALIFCYLFDKLLNYIRTSTPKKNKLNYSEKRRIIMSKFYELQKIIDTI